jgi:hypothetical protein
MSIVDGCVLRVCSGAEVRSGSLVDWADRPAPWAPYRGAIADARRQWSGLIIYRRRGRRTPGRRAVASSGRFGPGYAVGRFAPARCGRQSAGTAARLVASGDVPLVPEPGPSGRASVRVSGRLELDRERRDALGLRAEADDAVGERFRPTGLSHSPRTVMWAQTRVLPSDSRQPRQEAGVPHLVGPAPSTLPRSASGKAVVLADTGSADASDGDVGDAHAFVGRAT